MGAAKVMARVLHYSVNGAWNDDPESALGRLRTPCAIGKLEVIQAELSALGIFG